MDVLIVGASTRATAFSARRDRIDRFADRDLASIRPGQRITPEDDPDGLEDLAAEAPAGPWLCTRALENHPALVDWGPSLSALLLGVRAGVTLAEITLFASGPNPAARRLRLERRRSRWGRCLLEHQSIRTPPQRLLR